MTWQPGDRVVLARRSALMGDYGIDYRDYGKSGVVVCYRDELSSPSMNVHKYAILLDGKKATGRMVKGKPISWNVTADQLDAEEGPW